MLDVLFVTPDSSKKAYQGLADTFSAIEPPTWSLLLAPAVMKNGYSIAILDCDAERLTLEQSVSRVREYDARLVVFVLYGQNPNSGTTSMIGAIALADAIKDAGIGVPICFCGSHVQALPSEVLSHKSVDLVLLNEGVYALNNLLNQILVVISPPLRALAINLMVNHVERSREGRACRIEWMRICRVVLGSFSHTKISHLTCTERTFGTQVLTTLKNPVCRDIHLFGMSIRM